MPPRFAYWTILIDGKPTAFRARDQQELMPTLTQLRRTNEGVELKWFAQGRLWDSPDAQRAAGRRPPAGGEKRGADWRPGGQHKDPRARFDKEARRRKKREQRAEWNAPRERDATRPERPPDGGRPSRPPAHSGGSNRRRDDRRPEGWQQKPPREGQRPWSGKPRGERPWQNKPGRDQRPRQNKPSGGDQRPWRDKPPRDDQRPWTNKPPRGDRPWTNKPPRDEQPPHAAKPPRDRKRWSVKPPPPASGPPANDKSQQKPQSSPPPEPARGRRRNEPPDHE